MSVCVCVCLLLHRFQILRSDQRTWNWILNWFSKWNSVKFVELIKPFLCVSEIVKSKFNWKVGYFESSNMIFGTSKHKVGLKLSEFQSDVWFCLYKLQIALVLSFANPNSKPCRTSIGLHLDFQKSSFFQYSKRPQWNLNEDLLKTKQFSVFIRSVLGLH